MKKFRNKLIFLFLVSFVFKANAQDEVYDPQHTMLALNMAIVSVHKILATQDRLILDQEYQNIINNLSIGNIKSDPEITELYQKLMDISVKKKLNDNELKLVKKNYDSKMQNRFSSALTNLTKDSASALKDTAKRPNTINLFVGIGRLLNACVASYFKYQNSDREIRENLDEKIYKLQIDDVKNFNEMQKQLLDSSWKLMRKYSLPDEYRLVQKTMDDFYRAVEEPDVASRRLRMLKALEYDFKVYPPYWFYRARTAQEADDIQEANECFKKFDEVWRPVLRQDPYKLEVSKYKFSQLVKNGVLENEESKQQALNLLSEIRKNTLREDWTNNLFAATSYYSLGEVNEAIKCLQINLDFEHEKDLSNAMLYVIKKNVSPENLANDTLRALNLNNLLSEMPEEFRESALAIADYFDERENSIKYLEQLNSENRNPLISHALRIVELRKNDTSVFENISDLMNQQITSKDDIPIIYEGFFSVVKDYADKNNVLAQIFLADMYQYGWGIPSNKNQAVNYYLKAAKQNDIYSQIMYVNNILSNQKYDKVAVKISSENQNSAEGLFDEGMSFYSKGDFSSAWDLFVKSSARDYAPAMFMLGQMYERGEGVQKSLYNARVFYEKAASQGHDGAKNALSRLGNNLNSKKKKSKFLGIF